MPFLTIRSPRLVLASLTLLSLASCTSVEFYEKRAFSLWVMQFDEGPTDQHFQQKVRYSTEGAAGGIGTDAGGGCGCY